MLPHRIKAIAAAALLAASCGQQPPAKPVSESGKPVLTILSSRSEPLIAPVFQKFAEETGIDVRVKYRSPEQLAVEIISAGSRSTADIFIASHPVYFDELLTLIQPLPNEVTAPLPHWAKDPDGRWVGLAGRVQSIVYNREKLGVRDLPRSLAELTSPVWKGRIGLSPADPGFQSMIGSLFRTGGEPAVREWLAGIKANEPLLFPTSHDALQAVARGDVDAALISHQYVPFLRKQNDTSPIENHFLPGGSPGNSVVAYSAAILQHAPYPDEARRLVAFLVSPPAQRFIVDVGSEYPVSGEVPSDSTLPPISKYLQSESAHATSSDLAVARKLIQANWTI